MTQAPTPGPLSRDDVKLLVKGDLVGCGQIVGTLKGFADGWGCATVIAPNGAEFSRILHKGFTFIGRPDESGWMPWSGGENPVPGQRVQWRTRNETDRVMSVLSNNLDWTHECRRGFDPIIAFRLVPTAPVEASGSEREYSDAEILADTVPADLLDGEIVAFGLRMEGTAGLYPSIRNTEEGAAKLAARLAEESPENPPYVPVALSLRPQPSGETRALLERIAAVRARKDFTPQQANAGLLTVLDDCAAALALEGQQEDWRCPDCGAQADEWFDCCKNPARAEAQDEDAPCTDCGDTGVTHQTERRCSCQEAEAQDEGAAGYSVALLASYCGDDTSRCTNETPCLDCVRMANVYKIPKTALGEFVGELGSIAAPSPTPAADADRVRMPEKWFEVAEYAAERGLTVHESKMRLEEFQRVVTPQAIAALKSEAK